MHLNTARTLARRSLGCDVLSGLFAVMPLLNNTYLLIDSKHTLGPALSDPRLNMDVVCVVACVRASVTLLFNVLCVWVCVRARVVVVVVVVVVVGVHIYWRVSAMARSSARAFGSARGVDVGRRFVCAWVRYSVV